MAGVRDVVGPRQVIDDPAQLATYTTDWTGRFAGFSPLAVRPASTEEVARVVTLCREHGVAVTVQGGNTGLVGGGVPLHGEVLLSLRRLDALGDVDALGGQVTSGSGVTLGALQRAAAAAGCAYGVDLGARDSATIGGTVATNAGGLHVVRHGDTRAQVMGVEMVLGTGETVSRLGGLSKDNAGYDLAALACGSEGTLGVVTQARLRLVAPEPHRVVALVAFATLEPAVSAAAILHRSLGSLSAAELFLHSGLALVCEVTGIAPPFPKSHGSYLLVEAAGASDPADELAGAVESLNAVEDVAVASDAVRAAQLWRYREAHTEAINTLGAPHKMDVGLPLAGLAEFAARVPAVVSEAAPGGRTWLFGHAAVGNMHVNVTGVAPGDERVDDAVLRLALASGGSISAEHGIGTAKKRWLEMARSDVEIAAYRAIKRALDPDGVLSPHVLLPA